MLLIEPFIVPNFGEREGQTPRVHDVAAPLPTVTGQGAGSRQGDVAQSHDPVGLAADVAHALVQRQSLP